MLLLLHDFLLNWYNVKISFFLFISQPSIKKINGGKLKHSKVSNNNKKTDYTILRCIPQNKRLWNLKWHIYQ